jgi:hypothetical protein
MSSHYQMMKNFKTKSSLNEFPKKSTSYTVPYYVARRVGADRAAGTA